MNTCEAMQELISRLLDEELSPPERAALEEHLESCPECRAMYEAFAAVSDALQSDLVEPPASLRENVMGEIRREELRKKNRRVRRIWISAAAAVLALAIGLRTQLLPQSMSAAKRADQSAPLPAAQENTLTAGGAAEYAAAKEEPAEDAAAPNVLYEAAEAEEECAAYPSAAADSYSAAASGAAPAAPPVAADRGAARFDAAIPVLRVSLESAELLDWLQGEQTDAPTDVKQLYRVLTSDGELAVYASGDRLFFASPTDGRLLATPRGAAELAALAGS